MSILFLSVVISTTCAISSPTIDDRTIFQPINMMKTELVARHDSVQCWEEEHAGGWLSKHEGGTSAIATLALLACDIRNALLGEPSWGIHGYNQQSAQLLVTYLMNQGN